MKPTITLHRRVFRQNWRLSALFFFFILSVPSLRSQCNNPSAFGSAVAPTSNAVVTITTCAFGGEYSTVTGCVAGTTYNFTGSGGSGNYLTIRQGTSGGTVLGFGFSPISVVCTVSGSLYLHYNTNAACGTDGSCHTGTVQCTSCAAGPCANASQFPSGTVSLTPTNTTGALQTVTTCQFAGEYHVLTNVLSGKSYTSTSSVATDWITVHVGTFNGTVLAQGLTPLSYITTSTSDLFVHFNTNSACGTNSNCRTTTVQCTNCLAFDPCTSIATLSCGTAVTATTSAGTGAWSPGSCGFSTPGQEKIYSFTSLTTGMHTLVVTAASGAFADYFYKVASIGCNTTSWICIGDANSAESDAFGPLTAGTTYYILLDPEVTTSISQTFQIDCPPTGAAPSCISSPTFPSNGGSVCLNSNVTLSWPTSVGATSYDVYFGTATTPPFVANTATTTYSVGTLAAGNYYWQIRPKNASGTAAGCLIWSFTAGDNTPPAITCPANVTSNAPANACSAISTYGAITASDNCTAPIITLVSGLPSGSSYPIGITTIIYRATDGAGNSSTCFFTVTVKDVTPPTITCPANVTVNTTANACAAIATYGAITATDNCTAPTITLISGLPSGSSYPVGINTIIYRASDLAGNSSTCSFTVTIKDITPPTISCPAPVTVQCASLVPASNTASVITADLCSAPVVTFVSDVISNQTCANRYTLTRTYRSTDASGNSVTCAQIITVNDNTAPTITLTSPLLIGIPNGGYVYTQCYGQDPNWDPPSFSAANATAVDNCSGTAIITFSELLFDEGNCPVDGYINRYKLTWTATDVCGNSSSKYVFLDLIDDIPPVLHGLPADITVRCDQIPAPAVVTSTDECLCECIITYSQSALAPGCQNGQVITRSWSVKDFCGNVTVGKQYITLKDDQGPELFMVAPELSGVPNHSVLEYTCNEGGIPAFLKNLTAQAVSAVAVCDGAPALALSSSSHESNNCEFFGYIEERVYTWTGTDKCGNSSNFVLTVHLIDDEAPVLINVPAIACAGDPALNSVEAIDNCGNGNVRFWDVEIPNPCGTGKAYRRTYEGFDPCGNVTRDTTIILPVDNIPPTITFTNPVLAGHHNGDVISIECRGNATQASFGASDVAVSDNCTEGLSLSYAETLMASGDCSQNGILNTLSSTWTASDLCGNVTKVTLTVQIVDHTPPAFTNLATDITIPCNGQPPAANATDNCGSVSITHHDSIVHGPCEFEYDIYRTLTAIDNCGNAINRVQHIHVGDGSGPVISGIPAVSCDDGSLPEASAWDPCANKFVQLTMTQVTLQNQCTNGSTIIERTWTAVGACGHASHFTQQIIMGDHTPPTILIPSYSVIRKFIDTRKNLVFLSQKDIIIDLNELDEGSIFVTDNCYQVIEPVFKVSKTFSGNCAVDGYFERRTYSWVATDACGNSAAISFTVDIMDDLPPVFSSFPSNESIYCHPLPPAGYVQADDPAQPVTIQYSEQTLQGAAPGEYDVVRTWTATDACGNVAVQSQHIKWIPDSFLDCGLLLPQNVGCNSHGVEIGSFYSGGLGDVSYQWEVAGGNCFIQSGQGTEGITIYIGFSSVDVFLTVTDAFGCSSVCTGTLDCIDPLGLVGNVQNVTLAVSTNPAPAQIIAPVIMNELTKVTCWPNPANETLNLSFDADMDEEVQLNVLNFLGQSVLQEVISAKKGYNMHQMDLNKIPEGSYMMFVQTGKEWHTTIVAVIHNN